MPRKLFHFLLIDFRNLKPFAWVVLALATLTAVILNGWAWFFSDQAQRYGLGEMILTLVWEIPFILVLVKTASWLGQLHLLTAIIASNVAGVLLWLNLSRNGWPRRCRYIFPDLFDRGEAVAWNWDVIPFNAVVAILITMAICIVVELILRRWNSTHRVSDAKVPS